MFASGVRTNENPFHTRVTQATATATGIIPHEYLMTLERTNSHQRGLRYVSSFSVGSEEYGKLKISANDPLFIILDVQETGVPGDMYAPPLSVCSSVAGRPVPKKYRTASLFDLGLEFVGFSVAENIFAKVGQPHPDIGIFISGAITIFNNGPEYINANTELCYVPPPPEADPEYGKLVAALGKNNYVYRAQPILMKWSPELVKAQWQGILDTDRDILRTPGKDDATKLSEVSKELTDILARYMSLSNDTFTLNQRVTVLDGLTTGNFFFVPNPILFGEAIMDVRLAFEHNSRRQVIGRSLTHAFPGEQIDILFSTAV
jgi:hypothetical protein